jgi:iron complex transport system permease protein
VVSFKLSSLRVITVLTACASLTLAVFVLATTFGEQALSWRDLLEPESPARTILLSVRLPRVMLAGLVGGSLAAAGASLQALTRNALADPFVLGVSGGSALGATIAMVMNMSALSLAPGVSGTTLGSLTGAIGATLLVMAVGRMSKGGSNATLLAGVIFNSFALASVLFIKALAAPNELGDVLWWLAGRLGYEQGSTLLGAAVLQALGWGALWAWSGRLNLLMLGDEDAASLGIDVRRTRLGVLLVTSLMVSVAVSLSGLVGFVGLLVPHVVRLAIGSDHRVLIPASAICGAAFLAFADLLARVSFRAFQQELPVGVVTALLGGPLFLALMVRAKRRFTSSI